MQGRLWTGVLRGLAFTSVIFAIGFSFGVAKGLTSSWLKWTERDLLIVDSFEIVFILFLAWRLCRPANRGLARGQRVLMAITTLISLLMLEACVGVWLRGMSSREYLQHFATQRGGLSLFGYTLVSMVCVASHKRDADVTSPVSP